MTSCPFPVQPLLHSQGKMAAHGQQQAVVKESRHLWVGGLPDDVDESKIKAYFSR